MVAWCVDFGAMLQRLDGLDVQRLTEIDDYATSPNYTDDERVMLRAIRPAIMTCIGVPSRKPDFLDRCLRVTTLQIASPSPDELVRERFQAALPRMLGFLFRCVSAGFRRRLPPQTAGWSARVTGWCSARSCRRSGVRFCVS